MVSLLSFQGEFKKCKQILFIAFFTKKFQPAYSKPSSGVQNAGNFEKSHYLAQTFKPILFITFAVTKKFQLIYSKTPAILRNTIIIPRIVQTFCCPLF